jgi:nitrogen PTS system EIIA component
MRGTGLALGPGFMVTDNPVRVSISFGDPDGVGLANASKHGRKAICKPDCPATLAEFTSPALIVPRLHGSTGDEAICELCSVLEREGRVSNPLSMLGAVMLREGLCSTVTPAGMALPHARLEGLARLSFALGCSPAGLDWPGTGGWRVRLVLLFAVPQDEPGTYISLIAGLARLSGDPARLEDLLRARDAQPIFELLKLVPLRLPGRSAAD